MNDFSHLIVMSSHQIFLLFLVSIFNLIHISMLETVRAASFKIIYNCFIYIFAFFKSLNCPLAYLR